MHSLRSRLLALWLLSLLACVAVGVLLVQLYQLSASARTDRAEVVVARACDLVRERYASYVRDGHGPVPSSLSDLTVQRDLLAVVSTALTRQPGVEGGIWQADAGPLVYAFPTYPGEGPKTDLPAAEESRIRAVNEQAAREKQPVSRAWASPAETLLIAACPLIGPVAGLTGWTMTRVQAAPGYGRLGIGLGVLAAFVLGGAGWLTRLVVIWSRRVDRIEAALASAGEGGIPFMAQTGERELDRIVDALNEAGRRLAVQRRRSEELTGQVAAAERLASLGRVAAGIAHEIRNPLAAMRLRAENALAATDPARPRRALADILDQIARLDGLVTELLAMTQRRTPQPRWLDLGQFLASITERYREEAAGRGIVLVCASEVASACMDPDIAGRILDNLLLNALAHVPRDGRVDVTARIVDAALQIIVTDTGPGIAPDLRNSLFEPFMTGRADGTGLGLAIARELAERMQGRLTVESMPGRTVFTLSLPA
ncbi:MAG: sensor histidine kinase [Acetobacteraceae bacterium]|nr:sensor histidine kinase [Acetobacteraceae bacterium]